ncbi:Growth arrest-specific protein 8-like protein [Diplonema papillatum]|nr:Growth arrest-specific protein 8-like protein [Diplonema papillatum]
MAKGKGKGKKQKASDDGPQGGGPLLEMRLAWDALLKARQMRNFFQLEGAKVNGYWEISKKELESVRSALRNKEREKEELKERHQVEMKVYKQKVRHLLYEHKAQVSQLKTEAERALKNKVEDHTSKEGAFRQDRGHLSTEKKAQELGHRDQVHRMQLNTYRELTLLNQSYERQMKEIQAKYERKIKNLREEMEARRKMEIDDIERRKTEHVKELMQQHDKAFQDIRDYYNDITSNNLENIKSLKEAVNQMKKSEAYQEKVMFEIAQENKRLTEPLAKALKEVNLLRHELHDYENDKASLNVAKSTLLSLEQKMKALSWEHEVLQQRSEKLRQEKDMIFGKYQKMTNEIQQRAVFKGVVLHKNVEVLTAQLEKKDAQLGEVLKAAVTEGDAANVDRKLEDMLENKNSVIEELQQQLSALTTQHDDISGAYEEYFRQNGVPGLRTT